MAITPCPTTESIISWGTREGPTVQIRALRPPKKPATAGFFYCRGLGGRGKNARLITKLSRHERSRFSPRFCAEFPARTLPSRPFCEVYAFRGRSVSGSGQSNKLLPPLAAGTGDGRGDQLTRPQPGGNRQTRAGGLSNSPLTKIGSPLTEGRAGSADSRSRGRSGREWPGN